MIDEARAETGEALERLEAERYINLATYRRTGVPVETPVWFAAEAGKLYVFTSGTSGKVKRLRRSSRAQVAACDARGRLRGPWIEATAKTVEDRVRVEQAYSALRAKYGLQMRVLDFFSSISGRIHGRVILELEV
jgi:PPOX class probable F420-dependent enzyme